MVWFQCEDCGEDLKKPKLQHHFRICSANKFSCIDCGFTFNRESVQAHTQCISEQEKYGPKAEGKGISNSEAKRKPPTSQDCDVDLSVGLSIRPPWSCRLCNVKATSREALLLHSEGKKHRSKARAFQASNKSDQTVEPSSNGNISTHKPGDIITSKEQFRIADLQNGEKHEEIKGTETHNSSDKRNGAKLKKGEVKHLVCDNNMQDGAPGKKDPNIEEEKHSNKRKRKGDKSDLLESVTSDKNRKYKQEEAEGPVCANNKQDFTPDSDQDKCIEEEKDSKKKKKKKKGDKYSVFDSSNVENKKGQAAQQEATPKNVRQPTSLSDTKKGRISKMEKPDDVDAIDMGNFNDECYKVNKDLDNGNGNGAEAGENANRNAKEPSKLPVKWKKIIKSVLESSPDKSLRMKKLQKGVVPLAMKALESAGVCADESHVKGELMKKVLSSSRFVVDNKVVRLA